MDIGVDLGSLGNSSTASGCSHRRGTVGGALGPGYSYALGFLSFGVLLFISILTSLLAFFVCLFGLIKSVLFPCSAVWDNTRSRVPHFL